MENAEQKNAISLESVIRTALQIPGVKVDREAFLNEQFQGETPQCDRSALRERAQKIIHERTLLSTGASFVAGLPGGFAMAAAIPADIIQFYGMALRMAQELAYLYGEEDLWNGDDSGDDSAINRLILYCGVMFGVSGASQAVRLMSSPLAKRILKKLPPNAMTKTFYYPIVKSVIKWFGVSVTKGLFAKGVSKAVPVIGGFVSGGITFATLRPMGQRLADTLDMAHFSYTESDFDTDWKDIVEVNENEETETPKPEPEAPAGQAPAAPSVLEEITRAKQMMDAGILSGEEFSRIKEKLISQM